MQFQSTPPVKAATNWCGIKDDEALISIHAAREGGDASPVCVYVGLLEISIHAAREGGDSLLTQVRSRDGYFNPRRP